MLPDFPVGEESDFEGRSPTATGFSSFGGVTSAGRLAFSVISLIAGFSSSAIGASVSKRYKLTYVQNVLNCG